MLISADHVTAEMLISHDASKMIEAPVGVQVRIRDKCDVIQQG